MSDGSDSKRGFVPLDQLPAPKVGLTAALERVEGEIKPRVPSAVQTPLFPAELLDDLPGDSTKRDIGLRQRGPGRPKGALNRKTEDWADYLLNRYSSPLVGLAEICSRRVLDLAAELRCKPLEALAIQLRAMAELAPYLHGKKPVEIAFKGALPVFVFGDPGDYARRQAEGAGISAGDLAEIEMLGDQRVIDGDATRVEQGELNSPPNAEADQGDSDSATVIADHDDGRGAP